MSEWLESTVGDVTAYQKAGGTPTVSNRSFYGGEIPFVVIEDMTRNSRFLDSTKKTLTPAGLSNSAAWLIREPHILYSMYATVGKPVINRIECATNQAIIALKENEKIDQEYLFYVLVFIRGSIWRYTTQTTQSNLNASVVRRLPVSYPNSLPTQQKIARILQTVDRAIEKTAALIEKYQQIKAGLMHDLFTRGLWTQEELDRGDHQGTPAEATTKPGQLRPTRQDAPHLYQETPIGWIPRAWELDKLAKKKKPGFPHIQTGPFGTALKGEHWVEEGVPVITIGALGEGEITEPELLHVGDFDAKRLSSYRLRAGDVVFSRVADVGRSVAITENEVGWIMSSNLMRICLDQSLADANFLQLQLAFNHSIKTQIRCKVNSGGRDVANSEVLNSLFFAWPNPSEQMEVVARTKIVSCRLRNERLVLEKLQKQKSGLMHDLLTGEVPVTSAS